MIGFRPALLVAAACLLLLPRAAAAQLFETGPYLGVSAGVLMLDDRDGSVGPIGTGIEFEPGFDVAVQLGYRFSLFRAELELEYGEAAVDRVRAGAVSVDPDIDLSYVRGTVGAYADFTLLPLLTPYAGGGIGLAYVDSDAAAVNGVTIEIDGDAHLTLHGEVGLAIGVLPLISIVPAYRFIWIDNGDGAIDDVTAHLIKLGARIEF